MKRMCDVCKKFVYDEEKEGVKIKDLPDSWRCPVCNADKTHLTIKV